MFAFALALARSVPWSLHRIRTNPFEPSDGTPLRGLQSVQPKIVSSLEASANKRRNQNSKEKEGEKGESKTLSVRLGMINSIILVSNFAQLINRTGRKV